MEVTHVEDLVSRLAAKRQEIDIIARSKKVLDDELATLETQALEALKTMEKTSYSANSGTIFVQHRTSVKVPQDAARAAFFEYLKVKGLFENMITVNSATLNSFYKTELVEAVDAGNADFEIPGLTPSIMEVLSFRKK